MGTQKEGYSRPKTWLYKLLIQVNELSFFGKIIDQNVIDKIAKTQLETKVVGSLWAECELEPVPRSL